MFFTLKYRLQKLKWPVAAGIAIALAASGCHQGMWNNSRIKPLERMPNVEMFGGGRLTLVEGTVPFGAANTDEHLYTGKINGEYATSFPFEITREDLERGRNRYTIYCSPCHSAVGDGEGMIVQREMKKAGNYHQPRLRESPPGYFFDVMTNGFGVMYSYASRISPEDRWKIAAYIRVLQLSQNASIEDVPDSEKQALLSAATTAGQKSEEGSHAAH